MTRLLCLVFLFAYSPFIFTVENENLNDSLIPPLEEEVSNREVKPQVKEENSKDQNSIDSFAAEVVDNDNTYLRKEIAYRTNPMRNTYNQKSGNSELVWGYFGHPIDNKSGETHEIIADNRFDYQYQQGFDSTLSTSNQTINSQSFKNSSLPCDVAGCYNRDISCDPCDCNYNCVGLSLFGYFSGGESPGVDDSYETFGARYFGTLSPGSGCPLLDVRQHFLNDGTFASSFGIGYRFMNREATYVSGANIFYDFRAGSFDNFHQFGAGVEWLTPCFEFRLNGFIPINNGPFLDTPIVYDDYIGNYVVTATIEEFAFKGFEAEVGKLVIFPCNTCVYASVGPYYLSSNCCSSWGVQGRARLDIGSLLFGEVQITYDSIFNDRYRGIVGIDISLSSFFCCAKNCCCWFYGPIFRREIIPTNRCCKYKTNF